MVVSLLSHHDPAGLEVDLRALLPEDVFVKSPVHVIALRHTNINQRWKGNYQALMVGRVTLFSAHTRSMKFSLQDILGLVY